MLNEERVILMTKMASFEQHEGKKDTQINQYFRSDYVGLHVLQSFLASTLAFIIIVAIYAMCYFEQFISNLYSIDILALGKQYLIYYLLFTGAYSIASYIIYSYRYAKMRGNIRTYLNNLRKLSRMYEEE